MAVQGLVRLVIVPGVDGQVQIRALVRTERAVQEVIASQLVGKGVQRPGADAALEVTHRVEGSLADRFIIVIGTLAVFPGGQDIAVPVQHTAHD